MATGPGGCAREGAVDVVHHTIALSLTTAPPSLTGHGELRVRARDASRRIALDAHALRVASAAAQGSALRFTQDGETLCLELPRALARGEEIAVELAWSARTDGESPHFSADQAWAGYRASAWMPTRQDAAQRATLDLKIVVPAGFKVAASGRDAGHAPAGAGLEEHSFVLERPSPPFLYAFAAGVFEEAEMRVDGATLRALGPPGSDLKGALAITAAAHRFLTSHLLSPLPSAEYVQVFVHGDAAQEAAGMALLGEGALSDVRKDPTEDWIFSHELAHQWFAWLVPCVDFGDFWLNEGFATFLVAAVKEERWGRGAYDREVALWRTRSAKVHAEQHDAPLSLSRPGGAPHAPMRESELPPRGVTYARGALVLDKLRRELGDAGFWSGLQRYVAVLGGKGARSDDLRRALEAATHRDLAPFFDRWVYASAPDL